MAILDSIRSISITDLFSLIPFFCWFVPYALKDNLNPLISEYFLFKLQDESLPVNLARGQDANVEASSAGEPQLGGAAEEGVQVGQHARRLNLYTGLRH